MEKKKLFKNILITLLLSISPNFVFADSYIMISPANITKVECDSNEIIEMHVLNDLSNEKKSVIVSSKKDGSTTFYIKLKNKKCDYKVTVSDGKLKITGDRYIKILPIDLPPEFVSCDECQKGESK